MRLLLDESLPRGLKSLLTLHEVVPVQEQGWSGKSNGELLRLAEREFAVLVTADQNLEYQQSLGAYRVGVIVLAAATTRLSDLEPLISELLEAILVLDKGEVRRVPL